MQRLLRLLLVLVCLTPLTATALPRNPIAWDYGSIPGNMTLTGFQVQRCVTTSCGTACTLTDLVGGTVGAAVRTYTDTAVTAATSYLYDVQAIGTVDGNATRSTGTTPVCRRIPRPGPHTVGGGKIVR